MHRILQEEQIPNENDAEPTFFSVLFINFSE